MPTWTAVNKSSSPSWSGQSKASDPSWTAQPRIGVPRTWATETYQYQAYLLTWAESATIDWSAQSKS